MSALPPDQQPTLYVKNLNEKINVHELRKTLESVFGEHGEILAVKLWKNIRMRGQAFITFKEHAAAQRAIDGVKNLYIFGKPLVVKYAYKKSDATAERDGTLEQNKRKRKETQATRDEKFEAIARKAEHNSRAKQAMMQAGFGAFTIAPGEIEEPNNILFVQNIPVEVGEAELVNLFRAYPGFREVRLVPGRKDIAFAEFENDAQAGWVKDILNGFQIVPEKPVIKVHFARK